MFKKKKTPVFAKRLCNEKAVYCKKDTFGQKASFWLLVFVMIGEDGQ